MGEIGIHLEHEVEAMLERPAEAGNVGPPQPLLGSPVQAVNPRLPGSHLIGQLAGAIGRGVVHHQDLDPRILEQDRRNDLGQILRLVVGRDDDEDTLRHWPPSALNEAAPSQARSRAMEARRTSILPRS